MIRIWAKTIKNNKLVQSHIYERIDNFSPETFYIHIQELCHELDIPTPVVLNYHIKNYMEFNVCHFLKRDFVEIINFDKLIIEEASIK